MTVVIVGAGIIGTLTAWRVAEDGHAVTLVDDGSPGAWQVAAGMLAPALEAAAGEEDLLLLFQAGAAAWDDVTPQLESRGGTRIDLERAGSLLVARTDDDLASLREVLAVHRDLGLTAHPLRARACRDREPALHPRVRGGLWAPDDHRVDPRRVVAAARTAAVAAGVTIRTGRAVAVTDEDGGTATEAPATGVRLDDGSVVVGDTVVLAAGWRSRDLDGVPTALRRALRPVKGQLLVLGAPDGRPLLGATVRGLVRGRPVYLVPRPDGRLIVGATEEERGDDGTVTAGGIRTLLDDAVALVPGVDELVLHETLAGSRPGTADGRPLVGPTGRPGLVAATGHHRHGVLLGPWTADAVADLLAGRPTGGASTTDPRRFTPSVSAPGGPPWT